MTTTPIRFAAVALLAISASSAHARAPRAAAIITCDHGGCSDSATAGAGAAPQPRAGRQAGRKAQNHRRAAPEPSQRAGGGKGYEVRHTALGPIEVAPGFADKAVAVVDEIAASHPGVHVKCRSFSTSHVPGSLHFRSRACDVCQSRWGVTCIPRAELTAIVLRHGLRDGCEFRDWGHFDNGPHLSRARVIRNCGAAYADAITPGRVVRMASKPGSTARP